MAPYRIRPWDEDGAGCKTVDVECDDDDEVIDTAGRLEHPHTITIFQGERHVAEFPPIPKFPSDGRPH